MLMASHPHDVNMPTLSFCGAAAAAAAVAVTLFRYQMDNRRAVYMLLYSYILADSSIFVYYKTTTSTQSFILCGIFQYYIILLASC